MNHSEFENSPSIKAAVEAAEAKGETVQEVADFQDTETQAHTEAVTELPGEPSTSSDAATASTESNPATDGAPASASEGVAQ